MSECWGRCSRTINEAAEKTVVVVTHLNPLFQNLKYSLSPLNISFLCGGDLGWNLYRKLWSLDSGPGTPEINKNFLRYCRFLHSLV